MVDTGRIGAPVPPLLGVVEGKLKDILEVMLRGPAAEKKTALLTLSGEFEELHTLSIAL